MAQTEYNLSKLPKIPAARVAIIQSKWHREYSDVMVRKCKEALAQAEFAEPEVHILPGCYELPLAAKKLAQSDPSLEAIIAFGIIIKGDTFHFEMVMNETVRGLSTVMLEQDIPIINEILPVTEISQLEARCGDDDFNKGIEAAIAALEVVSWRRARNSK
jgi:6,7-dimethyl-8-ribityllumazine synthase